MDPQPSYWVSKKLAHVLLAVLCASDSSSISWILDSPFFKQRWKAAFSRKTFQFPLDQKFLCQQALLRCNLRATCQCKIYLFRIRIRVSSSLDPDPKKNMNSSNHFFDIFWPNCSKVREKIGCIFFYFTSTIVNKSYSKKNWYCMKRESLWIFLFTI